MGFLWWAGIPFLLLWGAIQIAVEVSDNLTLPRSLVFSGELRPEQEVFPVILPQGLALKEVVVSEGEQVNVGQTLAVLDGERIALRQQEVSAELAAIDVFLACLRANDGDVPIAEAMPQSELGTAVKDALRECRLTRESQKLGVDHLRSEVALLEEQKSLLQHKIRLSRSFENKQDFEGLEDIVSAALAATKIDERILEIQARRKDLDLQNEDEILAKLRQTKATKREREDENRLLAEALSAPRIVAQVAGRVGRVRTLPEGFLSQEDTEFTVLRPGERGGYSMTFAFPIRHRDQIGLGAKVRASLSGWAGPGPGPELQGQVTGILPPVSTQSSDHLIAEVTLVPASVQAIEAVGPRLALDGPGMASLLRVSLEEETLGQALERVVAQDFGNGDGVIHRIFKEFGRMPSDLEEG
ncbi:HlyD family secretion protein [Actibacterium pelagium]|uniref:Uncharacterized protein n=1 Tax=Actibacterium pelagium TaxID=2029103 RepID=A0A917EL41_9RHOB|nr:biotin/lipoyl-binding protein [Actibacterium pelagium]GGE51632.1 hypothetical protein GCM10011517_19190 [Actibacterium pelagium]